MADVSLTIALAGLAGVETGLGSLTKTFQGMGQQAEQASAKLKTISASTGALGQELSLLMIPAALIGGTMIKAGADFEQAMKTVEVTTHATAEEMARASQVTRDLGATTTFSANEAADALNILLRNGIDLGKALDGTLEATVRLAAATGTDLSTAADIVSSQMEAYGIAAADAGKATDVLYNASIQSKFSLTDFGVALGYAERSALPLGIAFDDLAVGLATTSFAFNEASSAGTGMATFLTRLQPQGKEAENAMRQLGLITAEGGNQFFDAQGKIKSFGEIATLLQEKLGGLSAAQKQAALDTIFMTQGAATANALMIAGAEAVQKNKEAIDRWGTTAEAAAKMMDTFWGALDRVGGAVEDVGIALTASGFIGGLTWLLNNLADVIGLLADMSPMLLNILAGVTGVAVALGPLLLAVSGLTRGLSLLLPAVTILLGPVGALAAGVTAMAAAFLYFKDNILGAFHHAIANTYPVLKTLADWLGIEIPKSVLTLGQHVAEVPADIQMHMKDVETNLTNPFAKAVPVATTHIENLGKSTEDTAKKVEEAFRKASAAAVKMADEQIDAITKTEAPLEDQVLAIARLGKELEGMGKEGAEGVKKVQKALSDVIKDGSAKELDFILNRTISTTEEQAKAVQKLAKDFEKYGRDGSEAQEDIFNAAQRLNAEVARNQIADITDDATKSLEEQRDALRQLYFDYVDMGDAGVSGANSAAAAIVELNRKIEEQSNVITGVQAALQDNITQWGGWGEQAGNIVRSFSEAGTEQLANFFKTGTLNADAMKTVIIDSFAQMAAETVVSMLSMGAKLIWLTLTSVIWGEMTFASAVMAATGLDITAVSAVYLDIALAPILIIVLAIAAAFAILYFAGINIGDVFKWIGDIVSGVLSGAFRAFMGIISALVGWFQVLVDMMAKVVGWIRTIGDELGQGDLKDLLDIFGGGFGGGVGKIFEGIGDFFGGFFQEGGWVGGMGQVPIVAHAGEFVVNPHAAAQHARLLEMINGGMNMHGQVQALGAMTTSGSRSGGDGGGGGNGAMHVHVHGSVISDSLSTSQVGRVLGRSIRKETKRLLGG